MSRAILWKRGAIAALLLLPSASTQAQNSFAEDVWRNAPPGQRPAAPAPRPPQPAGTGPGAPAPSMPASPGAQAQDAGPADPRFREAARVEAEDFGVAPTNKLHEGAMHAPTPTRIPGGLVITTEALDALYQQNQGKFTVFDVLGGERGLPGAQNAVPAAQAGSFTDQTQRDFGAYLEQVTQGNKHHALVFYCQSVHCWMSYNAALRAIHMGYTQVLWYRGGIEAWQQAGLQTYARQR